ncbi:hypothetical protein NCS57_01403900 [Fusarium keratoplasticum]|uniref:Uncharacterized protein n=1 Tax=Fusarium keratoplasticum TaxID=1328300 RepID=A0ACC0QCR2_9HYPO|nr:hypothetical protein NCS57_01403900 [Fusarium keratoplasticum]KAI8650694.1 hypothetical protein NCS57_01403900 [Fusarium keratoplasticum]
MQSETQAAEQPVEKGCASGQASEQAVKRTSTFDQSLYPFDTANDQLELSKLLKNTKHDLTLHGVVSLGTDGIFRSLTADREVVDAVPFSPRQIKALLDRMPFNPENETKFRGVDGRGVPQEQWFHPDKSLLPPPLPLTDEQRRFGEANKEKNRKMLEERANRPRCPLRIVSDHDLGLRVTPGKKGN